jgi:hypothetical protein
VVGLVRRSWVACADARGTRLQSIIPDDCILKFRVE